MNIKSICLPSSWPFCLLVFHNGRTLDSVFQCLPGFGKQFIVFQKVQWFEQKQPPQIHVCECLAHSRQHCQEVWPYWSRCGLVGGTLSLWRWALKSNKFKSGQCETVSFCCLQIKMQDSHLLLRRHVCRIGATSRHDDNGLNLELLWPWCLLTAIETLPKTERISSVSLFLLHLCEGLCSWLMLPSPH